MKSNKILLDEIEKEFNKIQLNEKGSSRKNWTSVLFKALYEIGQRNKYKVYSSSTEDRIPDDKGGPEWLFDLCWSIENNSPDGWQNGYKGLKLICESEWTMSEDEILYDFQKLAVGKAEIKIMIIQFNDLEWFKCISDKCEKSIDKTLYSDNATYILVGSGNNDSKIKWINLWESDKTNV